MEQEYKFSCPYCGENISIMIDPAETKGIFTEDCEVCCNPIEISYAAENGEIITFKAQKTDD